MYPFRYDRSTGIPDAVRAMTRPASATTPTSGPQQFIAGGTQLVDLMKLGTIAPGGLIDINGLPMTIIDAGADGLKLGALVRMAELERHPAVIRDYPVLAETMALAASQQIRTMASLAGNTLQRTRCEYFRDTAWPECNKRNPGSGCAAIGGVTRKMAVLGTSDHCIATYPGDFAQALVALGAVVHTTTRTLPFEQLHTGADRPHVETVLAPDELITGFVVPAGPWTRRSTYVKVRDRESYAYGLATAAVALHIEGGIVKEARIGLGGVAYKPWRAHEAELALRGKTLNEDTATAAARAAFAGAKSHGANDYKIDLGQRTLVRALLQANRLEG